jgi:TolA protein
MPGRRHATTTRMSFSSQGSRAASTDLVNRRLASGLLLSILFHALLLSLRFGVPGLGLPSPFTPPPITIVLAPPAPVPETSGAAPVATETPQLPPVPAPKTGMRMVDPLPPAPPAAPKVAKAKPNKPRRISRPLPPREPVESPTRVIAQDQKPNDTFVVPLPQPEESAQKTIDPKEAQDGSDDAAAAAQAALLAEEKQKQELAEQVAAESKAEREQEARLLAERRADEESRRLAEEQRRLAQELAEQQRRAAQQQAEAAAAREARERALNQAAQEQQLRQQADQLAARQRADELALRQKAEELAQRQKAEELAARRRADELAARQRAEDLARQQAAETARLQAEQLARQQAEQLARQQAEQLARQKAEQLARQQAEQLARQQAEQVEQAARRQAEQGAQREREQAASATASAGSGAKAPGSGGTGTTVPNNMFGSDAGNRVRELTRGIDLLSGDPPQRARRDDDHSGRRVVVGAGERDVPLKMYVDSFCQKVERNGAMALAGVGERVRIDPLVSVAIRSDGSVDEVTIVRSSGRAEVDNAVRRIVRINTRFSAFPPNVAAKYDVIEIRRIWSFADSLKLMEELR